MEIVQLIVEMVGLGGIGFAALLGWRQLRDGAEQLRLSAEQQRLATAATKGTFLLELDRAMKSHADITAKLSNPSGAWHDSGPRDEPEAWLAVEAYMGLFERVEVLIDEGLLEIDTFDALYGYRVLNIVNNDQIRQDKLESDLAQYWQHFLLLYRRLEENGRHFPKPILRG